jgi:FkbM family methyltransferase
MIETTVLTLVDGVRIVVPDSLDLITPYVLREQQDFFEDELPFVRSLLEPGQHVIDIGANYGVYTLPMAQKIGPSGHVWAFEPASGTAGFLAQSITVNGFGQVTLEQKAVSSTAGSAQLGAHIHSELRAIVRGASADGGETVSLVTLDDCMDRYRWSNIDFIKIDAEGEESNIVRGGRRFFASLGPLVQYELRTTDMNLDLISEFAAIGYDSYRLVPGLNVLVPFDLKSPPDPYLLNLFCCNSARAGRLAARGLLLRSVDLAHKGELVHAKYHWRHALARMAYAAPLVSQWAKTEEAGKSAEVQRALSLYACSRDKELSLAQRFHALEAGFLELKALCDRQPSGLRLASLARAAHDYGARAVSVSALNRLIESIRQTGIVDPSEPFLAPLERFDSIAPGEALGNWILGSALEQLERRESFSTFYVGPTCRDRLEAIHALGFAGPDMQRRLELVRLRIRLAMAAKERQATGSPK